MFSLKMLLHNLLKILPLNVRLWLEKSDGLYNITLAISLGIDITRPKYGYFFKHRGETALRKHTREKDTEQN